MNVAGVVRRRTYRDSIEMMRLARTLEALPGVLRAAALMGTRANLLVLADAGLCFAGAADATAEDLVVAVAADGEPTTRAALEVADSFLAGGGASAAEAGLGNRPVPVPSLAAAAAELGGGLAIVSTAGPFAAAEALKALKCGLDVFLFSDNVALADEVALKREAARRGRLVMGPDCGTAIVGGVPLGFANAVRPGSVGLVGASGTGLQEVTCLIDRLGGGISHAIGVGGRDLGAAVGGAATLRALELLADDAATESIVIVSKPPAPAVAERILAAAAATDKPVVACFVGGASGVSGSARIVATLEAAALEALGLDREAGAAFDLAAPPTGVTRGAVRGLYSGGTLAYEAKHLLAERLDAVAYVEAGGPGDVAGHAVVDLGADAFTRGRAHPMIDPRLRNEWVLASGADRSVGVLLLDVVLGHGSHEDPAGALVPALAAARGLAETEDRRLSVVASVCGTRDDPQGFEAQETQLRDVGVLLAPSNAAAARLAATLAGGAP